MGMWLWGSTVGSALFTYPARADRPGKMLCAIVERFIHA